MIAANELRIGNWVNSKGKPGITSWITDQSVAISICEDWVQYKDISGIPLTSEILEKCGFKNKHSNDSGEWKLNNTFSIWDQENGCFVFEVEYKNMEYLHQLQNLYFALSGKELNYQP